MRVRIYARYSSELQRAASIEDQIRVCKERADRENWTILGIYTDYAVTGAFMNRPGIQQLRQDIAEGEIILAEALDRFSRDQEDIAGFYKRAQFAGVKMFTLSEGEITPLHIGLKGTMNAIMLTDMKDKVKRGQRGRVEVGRIGGGNCYGYRVVRRIADNNQIENGERTIDQEEAEIVRRIFRDFADGKSPRRIASDLNREGVPGPRGKKDGDRAWREGKWQQSTIYGNWQRGSGILNNELYRGSIVWNKVSYPRNPETGKPVARVNPESDWVRAEVPGLRIIDEDVWLAAKARQRRTRTSAKKFWQHQRPTYLFSGLLKCGCCGGGFAKISVEHYGCSTARNKGDAVCANRRNIRQDELEQAVLYALQSRLMDQSLLGIFCKEYAAHLNRLRDTLASRRKTAGAEIDRLKARASRIVRMAIDGYGSEALKEELHASEAKQKELQALLESEPQPSNVRVHPDMAERYRREVQNLIRLFNDDSQRNEAVGLIRSLIEKIVLVPDQNTTGFLINLHGELAGILNLAQGKMEVIRTEEDLRQIRLVAGLDDIKQVARESDEASAGSTSRRVSTPRRPGRGKLVGPPFNTFSQNDGGKLVGPEGLEPPTKRL
jgi:site-specific DNA recombinase